MQTLTNFYTCPICQSIMTIEPKRWFCKNNHNFDVAKQGYINLLPAQHKKSKNPGDDVTMVQTRQQFLASGFYEPLKTAMLEILANQGVTPTNKTQHLLDIGCGEGYYTSAFANLSNHTTAVDISKPAVQATAKLKLDNTISMVASASKLPIASHMVDIAISIFSPILPDELARIITENGLLLIAKPQPKHLLNMRELLFDEVKLHDSDKFIEQLAPHFHLIEQKQVSYSGTLNNTQLHALLAMTPYAYRAKPEKRANVEAMQQLMVTAKFCIYLCQRKV